MNDGGFGLEMASLMILIAAAVAIILVYFGSYKLLKWLHKKGRVWLVAFAVFISPSLFMFIQIRTLQDFVMALLFTPYFWVGFLMMQFPIWIILYYSLAYGTLAVVHYLHLKSPFIRTVDAKK